MKAEIHPVAGLVLTPESPEEKTQLWNWRLTYKVGEACSRRFGSVLINDLEESEDGDE